DTPGPGNDPSFLGALAFADSGYLTQSPADAQKRIEELMKSKEYLKGDRLVQVKLHALSRIAHRDVKSENGQLAAAAQAKAAVKPAGPAAGAESDADVRATLAKMMSDKT